MEHALSLELRQHQQPQSGTATTLRNTSLPDISGTSEVGQTLVASNGNWAGPGTLSFAFQWRRNGTPITGATGNSLPLMLQDVGANIDVVVTADSGTQQATATSQSVQIDLGTPAFTAQPTLTPLNGPVGTVFTLSLGTAEPNATVALDALTLDGTDLGGQITNLTWDSTGAAPGTLLLRSRATNSDGVALSNFATAVLDPVVAVPDAFSTGAWSVADDATGGTLTVALMALAFDGGSQITDVEYRIDGGNWASSGLTTTGSFQITGLTDDQTYSIDLRAVNSVGPGANGTAKSATPTAPGMTGVEIARFGTGNIAGSGAFDTQGQATDGTYGAFVVQNGVITPDGTQLVGTYTVGGYPVSVAANEIAVANQGELDALNSGHLGMTIVVRVGAVLRLNHLAGDFGSSVDMLGTKFMGDGPDPRLDYAIPALDATAHFDTVVLRNCANVTFENLRMVTQNNSVNATCLEMIGGYSLTGPCVENVEIRGCLLKSGNPDPFGDYSGGSGSFPGGKGVLSQANMFPKGISVIDNVFYGHDQAIEVHATGQRYVEIIGNRIDMNYQDFIKPGTTGETPLLIAGNYCTRPLGLASDAGNPHPDILQITGSSGLDTNIVLEANFFFSGSTRALGGAQVWFFNGNSGSGVSGLIRGCGNVDSLVRSYSIYRPNGFVTEYCATLPDETVSLPSGSGLAGHRYESVVSGSDIRNSFFGNILTGSNINTSLVSTVLGWTPANLSAALTGYPVASTDGPFEMHEVLSLFAPTNGGPLDGKGPYAAVSITPGQELSAYDIDPAVAPQPVLSGLTVSPGTNSFTASIRTDVALNPIYWAVVPQTANVLDPADIKKQRISGAVDYGYRRVLSGEGDAQTAIVLTGTNGALQSATPYKLVAFQENGWTKKSVIAQVNFTTS